jgi:hypothetical protein
MICTEGTSYSRSSSPHKTEAQQKREEQYLHDARLRHAKFQARSRSRGSPNRLLAKTSAMLAKEGDLRPYNPVSDQPWSPIGFDSHLMGGGESPGDDVDVNQQHLRAQKFDTDSRLLAHVNEGAQKVQDIKNRLKQRDEYSELKLLENFKNLAKNLNKYFKFRLYGYM